MSLPTALCPHCWQEFPAWSLFLADEKVATHIKRDHPELTK